MSMDQNVCTEEGESITAQNTLTMLAELSKLQVDDIGKGVLTNRGIMNSSDINR